MPRGRIVGTEPWPPDPEVPVGLCPPSPTLPLLSAEKTVPGKEGGKGGSNLDADGHGTPYCLIWECYFRSIRCHIKSSHPPRSGGPVAKVKWCLRRRFRRCDLSAARGQSRSNCQWRAQSPVQERVPNHDRCLLSLMARSCRDLVQEIEVLPWFLPDPSEKSVLVLRSCYVDGQVIQ